MELNEATVHRLNLQPGETLIVTIKHDGMTSEDLRSLSDKFKAFLPNNKVAVLSVESAGDVKFTTIKDEEAEKLEQSIKDEQTETLGSLVKEMN